MSFARQALTLFSLLAVASGVSAFAESSLTSVGASLPARLYRNWFAQMASSGGPEVSYRSVGSASAQWALIRQTVDFAVSDAPMQPKDLAKVRRGVVQIPIAGTAIAFAYNQPGCDLKLTQQQAVQLASGRITDWKQLGSESGSLIWVYRSDVSGNRFLHAIHAVVFLVMAAGNRFVDSLARWSCDRCGRGLRSCRCD